MIIWPAPVHAGYTALSRRGGADLSAGPSSTSQDGHRQVQQGCATLTALSRPAVTKEQACPIPRRRGNGTGRQNRAIHGVTPLVDHELDTVDIGPRRWARCRWSGGEAPRVRDAHRFVTFRGASPPNRRAVVWNRAAGACQAPA